METISVHCHTISFCQCNSCLHAFVCHLIIIVFHIPAEDTEQFFFIFLIRANGRVVSEAYICSRSVHIKYAQHNVRGGTWWDTSPHIHYVCQRYRYTIPLRYYYHCRYIDIIDLPFFQYTPNCLPQPRRIIYISFRLDMNTWTRDLHKKLWFLQLTRHDEFICT